MKPTGLGLRNVADETGFLGGEAAVFSSGVLSRISWSKATRIAFFFSSSSFLSRGSSISSGVGSRSFSVSSGFLRGDCSLMESIGDCSFSSSVFRCCCRQFGLSSEPGKKSYVMVALVKSVIIWQGSNNQRRISR